MKVSYFLLFLGFLACNQSGQDPNTINNSDSLEHNSKYASKEKDENQPAASSNNKKYSNARFKEVTVEKVGEHKYVVKGKGQVYEANFGWVVEDGHYELLKGHQMTEAGAPDWGSFEFSVEVEKERPNSTLMLILFESSPQDGSRQYELPIMLD